MDTMSLNELIQSGIMVEVCECEKLDHIIVFTHILYLYLSHMLMSEWEKGTLDILYLATAPFQVGE